MRNKNTHSICHGTMLSSFVRSKIYSVVFFSVGAFFGERFILIWSTYLDRRASTNEKKGKETTQSEHTRNSHIISHVLEKQMKPESVTKIEKAPRNNYPKKSEKQKQTSEQKHTPKTKKSAYLVCLHATWKTSILYILFGRPYADGVQAILFRLQIIFSVVFNA